MPEPLPKNTSDLFQTRYEAHQKKKKEQLAFSKGILDAPMLERADFEAFERVLQARRTQRTFKTQPIEPEILETLSKHISLCPSSCNRQGISLSVIESRHDKEVLSGLLVGGVGWCHRADKILLVFANPKAYKAPGEINFMTFLDAGVVIQQLYLSATALNIGIGYINPNLREENKKYFIERFNTDEKIFCGALALGYFEFKAEETPKDSLLLTHPTTTPIL